MCKGQANCDAQVRLTVSVLVLVLALIAGAGAIVLVHGGVLNVGVLGDILALALVGDALASNGGILRSHCGFGLNTGEVGMECWASCSNGVRFLGCERCETREERWMDV